MGNIVFTLLSLYLFCFASNVHSSPGTATDPQLSNDFTEYREAAELFQNTSILVDDRELTDLLGLI